MSKLYVLEDDLLSSNMKAYKARRLNFKTKAKNVVRSHDTQRESQVSIS